MIKENRLLNLKDFAVYAGSLSRNTATKLAKESGACIQVGRRVLVDRVKFDAWLDRQNAE